MAITTGRSASPSERRSWERSLPCLRAGLIDAGLGDVEMLVEYQLPLTSKRADVVLAGQHPQTGRASYLAVELKQWSEAERFEDSDVLVRIDGYGNHPVLHPLEQVRGYCDYLTDFVVTLAEDEHELAGTACTTRPTWASRTCETWPPLTRRGRCGCSAGRTGVSSSTASGAVSHPGCRRGVCGPAPEQPYRPLQAAAGLGGGRGAAA